MLQIKFLRIALNKIGKIIMKSIHINVFVVFKKLIFLVVYNLPE
jgi:hypothetical protein